MAEAGEEPGEAALQDNNEAQQHGEASFQDNGEASLLDSGEAPFQDNGEAPLLDNVEAPFQDSGEAPFQDNGEAPLLDNGEAPLMDNGEAVESLGGGDKTLKPEDFEAEDFLILDQPIFDGISRPFRRYLLRKLRIWEYIDKGQETWYDENLQKVRKLPSLEEDELPPFKDDVCGRLYLPGGLVSKGGEFEQRLLVVMSGTVEKIVGEQGDGGGGVVVRTMTRGDAEGFTEFLNAGTEQRTATFRAGPGTEKAWVRQVPRDCLLELLKELADDADPEDPEAPKKWQQEIEWFHYLSLSRITSLPHQSAGDLLKWNLNDTETMEIINIPGQSMFTVDNALGTSVSGPLPSGLEERYFTDGQVVLKHGVPGDSLIMVLRGEIEAEVFQGVEGNATRRCCMSRHMDMDESWVGDGRDHRRRGFGIVATKSEASARYSWEESSEPDLPSPISKTKTPEVSKVWEISKASGRSSNRNAFGLEMSKGQEASKAAALAPPPREVVMCSLVEAHNLLKARKRLQQAAEAGRLDLSQQKTTDYRWTFDDPDALTVFEILRKAKLLSAHGELRAEEVSLHQNPPEPDPPPLPQAKITEGMMVGQLCLLGIPVVLGGPVRAKGPVLIAVLHRHVLLEALKGLPEAVYFEPQGLRPEDCVRILQQPPPFADETGARPDYLGPNTGPPQRFQEGAQAVPGSFSAFKSAFHPCRGLPGADALEYLKLVSFRNNRLFWELIHSAPIRLLEELSMKFEPRWLLCNEVIITSQEYGPPAQDTDFLFIVMNGTCNLFVEGQTIAEVGPGTVLGDVQLLSLSGWTKTVRVSLDTPGEVMIQVITRPNLQKSLAGHPVPKETFREIEGKLRRFTEVDWQIVRPVPGLGNSGHPKFLARLLKDADIRFHCPGDFIAKLGDPTFALIIVLAGKLRSEQPQTLFFVELQRGQWCFQDSIMGNSSRCGHDLVAMDHCLVLMFFRHTLMGAIRDFPEAREVVAFNETWRQGSELPLLASCRIFDAFPPEAVQRLQQEATCKYYREGAVVLDHAETFPDDCLLFVMRGELKITNMNTEIRTIKAGQVLGELRFMGFDVKPPPRARIIASQPSDCWLISQRLFLEIVQNPDYEDVMFTYRRRRQAVEGGTILDAYGFPIPEAGSGETPQCLQKADMFRMSSRDFLDQLSLAVEDIVFWPGEKLYSQWEPGEVMYFIRAGRVKVEVFGLKESVFVGHNHSFGELVIMESIPAYNETVIADTAVWARMLHRKVLYRTLKAFPEEEKKLQVTVGKPIM